MSSSSPNPPDHQISSHHLYTIYSEESEFESPAHIKNTTDNEESKQSKKNQQNLTHDLSNIAYTMVHSNSNTTLNNINQLFFNNQYFNSPDNKLCIQEQHKLDKVKAQSSRLIESNKENKDHLGGLYGKEIHTE
jgi:hypothetical protein